MQQSWVFKSVVTALAAPILSISMTGHVLAQDSGLFSRVASVTFGPYVRFELGRSQVDTSDAKWHPPGSSDPTVFFSTDEGDYTSGAVAMGYDFQNGLRAEVAFIGTGTSGVTGSCSSASDSSSCSEHADITKASVSTSALMGNVYYAPLEARGSHSIFQPFIVAGLGVARNTTGEWTRYNAASERPERTFEGASSSGLAWSVGVGASVQLRKPGAWPIILEGSWRYYDYGTAKGGATALPENGESSPITPLQFDHTDQVLAVGLRIPLRRY